MKSYIKHVLHDFITCFIKYETCSKFLKIEGVWSVLGFMVHPFFF